MADAQANIKIGVNAEPAKKEIGKTGKMLGDLGKAAGQARTGFSGMYGGMMKLANAHPLLLAIIGGFAAIRSAVKKVFSMMTEGAKELFDLDKQAKAVNMTANQYMALQYACQRAGIDMEKMFLIINKLDYAIEQSMNGNKKYIKTFADLGLDFRELSRLSPEKQIVAIADAMNNLKISGSDPRLAQLFGRKNTAMILNQMKNADMSNLIQKAGAAGIRIDPKALETAVNYTNSLGETETHLKNMYMQWEGIIKLQEMSTKVMDWMSKHFANGYMTPNFGQNYVGAWTGIENSDDKKLLANILSNNLSGDEKRKLPEIFNKYTSKTKAKITNTYGVKNDLSGADIGKMRKMVVEGAANKNWKMMRKDAENMFRKNITEYVNSMDINTLQEAYLDKTSTFIESYNIKNNSKAIAEDLIAEYMKGFDAADPNTWNVKKINTGFGKLTTEGKLQQYSEALMSGQNTDINKKLDVFRELEVLSRKYYKISELGAALENDRLKYINDSVGSEIKSLETKIQENKLKLHSLNLTEEERKKIKAENELLKERIGAKQNELNNVKKNLIILQNIKETEEDIAHWEEYKKDFYNTWTSAEESILKNKKATLANLKQQLDVTMKLTQLEKDRAKYTAHMKNTTYFNDKASKLKEANATNDRNALLALMPEENKEFNDNAIRILQEMNGPNYNVLDEAAKGIGLYDKDLMLDSFKLNPADIGRSLSKWLETNVARGFPAYNFDVNKMQNSSIYKKYQNDIDTGYYGASGKKLSQNDLDINALQSALIGVVDKINNDIETNKALIDDAQKKLGEYQEAAKIKEIIDKAPNERTDEEKQLLTTERGKAIQKLYSDMDKFNQEIKTLTSDMAKLSKHTENASKAGMSKEMRDLYFSNQRQKSADEYRKNFESYKKYVEGNKDIIGKARINSTPGMDEFDKRYTEMMAKIEKEQGFGLTSDQVGFIENQIKFDLAKEGADKMGKEKLQNSQIFTNELASRGGFSSSVKVDRKDNTKDILKACTDMRIYLQNMEKYQKSMEAKL